MTPCARMALTGGEDGTRTLNAIVPQNGPNSRRIAVALCAIAACLALPMVLAPAIPAQSVIDQYQPRPDRAAGSGGGNGGDSGGLVRAAHVPGGDIGPAANTAVAGGRGGDLPVTGYPLTPLIIALLILLAVGVAIRTAVEVRARRARG